MALRIKVNPVFRKGLQRFQGVSSLGFMLRVALPSLPNVCRRASADRCIDKERPVLLSVGFSTEPEQTP